MPLNNINLNFSANQRPKNNVKPNHAFDAFLNQKNSAYEIFVNSTSHESISLLKENKPKTISQKCKDFFNKYKKQILISASIIIAGALLYKNRRNITELLNKQKPEISTTTPTPAVPISSKVSEIKPEVTAPIVDLAKNDTTAQQAESVVKEAMQNAVQETSEAAMYKNNLIGTLESLLKKKEVHEQEIAQEVAKRKQYAQQVRISRKLQDASINQQLHPSGKSAEKSAKVFIEQIKKQELEKQELQKERVNLVGVLESLFKKKEAHEQEIAQEPAIVMGLLPERAESLQEFQRFSQYLKPKVSQTLLTPNPIVQEPAIKSNTHSVVQKAKETITGIKEVAKKADKKTGFIRTTSTKQELIRKPNGLFYTEDGKLASGSFTKQLKDSSTSTITFEDGVIVKSLKHTKKGRRKEYTFAKTYKRKHTDGSQLTSNGEHVEISTDEMQILTSDSPTSETAKKHVITKVNQSGKTIERMDSFFDVHYPSKPDEATIEQEVKRIVTTPVSTTTYDATRGFDNFSLMRKMKKSGSKFGFDVLPNMAKTRLSKIKTEFLKNGTLRVVKKIFTMDEPNKYTEAMLNIFSEAIPKG